MLCDKFIAICRAMSGPPSGRKIVCTVVALPARAKRSLHIPQKSPAGRCPPQPLSSTAVCCHKPPPRRRAQNVVRDLHHCPPPLGPVSAAVYCRQRCQPPTADRRRHRQPLLLVIVATIRFFKTDCWICVHLLHVTVPATAAHVPCCHR